MGPLALAFYELYCGEHCQKITPMNAICTHMKLFNNAFRLNALLLWQLKLNWNEIGLCKSLNFLVTIFPLLLRLGFGKLVIC